MIPYYRIELMVHDQNYNTTIYVLDNAGAFRVEPTDGEAKFDLREALRVLALLTEQVVRGIVTVLNFRSLAAGLTFPIRTAIARMVLIHADASFSVEYAFDRPVLNTPLPSSEVESPQ